MRVWFLKETKGVCTSCGTGCSIVIGSRENKIYRYTPRDNEAVNGCWMCDYGRLNFKWIERADRLQEVSRKRADGARERTTWSVVLKEISQKLKQATQGSAAIIASSRQSNEELYLLAKLARRLGALTDSIPRRGESDKLLLNADRNPNSTGAKLTGFLSEAPGSNLKKLAEEIQRGKIRTLIVFGEDLTKHGLSASLLGRLETLIVSDLAPGPTTELAHYLLPGCAPRKSAGHSPTPRAGQKFMKAFEPPATPGRNGNSCTNWFST